jgi:hypothetical protein
MLSKHISCQDRQGFGVRPRAIEVNRPYLVAGLTPWRRIGIILEPAVFPFYCRRSRNNGGVP